MTETELENAYIKKHFPDRIWLQSFNGKWFSREPTSIELDHRRNWVRKAYTKHFQALNNGKQLEIIEE